MNRTSLTTNTTHSVYLDILVVFGIFIIYLSSWNLLFPWASTWRHPASSYFVDEGFVQMLSGYGFVFVVVIVVSWYPKTFCFVEYVKTFRLLCWWRLGVMILPWCVFSSLFSKTLFPLGRENTYLLLWCWITCTAAVYYVGMIGLLFVLVRFLGCIRAPTCCCDVGDLAQVFVPLSWPVSCDVLLVLEDKTLLCEDT